MQRIPGYAFEKAIEKQAINYEEYIQSDQAGADKTCRVLYEAGEDNTAFLALFFL